MKGADPAGLIALLDRAKEGVTMSFGGEGVGFGAAASTGGAINLNATGGKPTIDESKPKTSI